MVSPLSPVSTCAPASNSLGTRPTVVDLFCGCGGTSLGFEQAGFDVLAGIDYDPVHAATWSYNFPLSEVVCADVRSIGAADVVEAARRGARRHGRSLSGIDVLVGGIPSPGLSTIGYRRLDDPRNELLDDFVRIVCDVSPRLFVLETVPGANRRKHARLLHQAVLRLQAAGWAVARPCVLNAADFGIPQQRERLFLYGARHGQQLPAE